MCKWEKMEKTKKWFRRLVVGTLVVSTCCLAGCGGQTSVPGETGEKTDENKTQLVVATFDGGVGSDWLKEAGERFEKKFADTSFEEGKTGVQVTILKSTNYGGEAVLDTLQSEEADVWFTETMNYKDHINYENLADITDVVTEPLKEYGEDESIADKIDASYRDFLNVGTEDAPQYYAIPFYDGCYGLVYDKDLFAEKNLYFKSSGTEVGDAADNLGFVSSESDTKSAGVDGKLGTYDDGLPATYAQFKALLAKMVENDITPFVYGGSNAMNYTLRTMTSFWAQAEGAEGYRLNSTLSGTADDLVVLNANGNVQKNADGSLKVESLAINTENGYELQRQAGKYQVLDLFKTILKNNANYSDSNLVHTAAQSDFLKGMEDEYTTYGLLIDGTWWENEADESFKALASRFGEEHSRANRNLAFMPLPVPTESEVGQGTTLVNANQSLAFIRSTTDIMDCAKAFLQFTTTDEELAAFTASVSMTRSFEYDLPEEYAKKTSPYGRSLHEMRKASTIVYPYSDQTIYQNNQAFFSVERWSWQTEMDNAEYINPWQLWLTYGDQYSADQYFAGMYRMQKTRWGTLVK